MAKQLVLFPGAHATGHHLLQSALELNREAVEALGISVARRREFYRSGLLSALTKPTEMKALTSPARSSMLSEVFGGAPKDTAVISIENVFGEDFPGRYGRARHTIEALKELFPGYDIRVVLYVRRQDTFAANAFARQVQAGISIAEEAFVEDLLAKPFDWLELVKAIARGVSEDNIIVVPYETFQRGRTRYLSDFWSHILPSGTSSFDDAVNRSKSADGGPSVLSRRGLEIMKLVTPSLLDGDERKIFGRCLAGGFPEHAGEVYQFSRPNLDRLESVYAPLNLRFTRSVNIGPTLTRYYRFISAEAEGAGPNGVVST